MRGTLRTGRNHLWGELLAGVVRQWLRVVFTFGAVSLAQLPDPASGDPLPALDPSDRGKWAAVGRVNGAGIGRLTGCTGTLIAPDLVLTAAHCTGARQTISDLRHFIAGWDRGSFLAHRTSAEIAVHPLYAVTSGTDRLRYDVAVIELDAPIRETVLPPLPLIARAAALPGEAGLLGYHNKRPHVLNGRFDCPFLSKARDDILHLGCEVIGGNSGGPVLVPAKGGWAVAAILVARVGPQGFALAVPVDEWVRSQWQMALARARTE